MFCFDKGYMRLLRNSGNQMCIASELLFPVLDSSYSFTTVKADTTLFKNSKSSDSNILSTTILILSLVLTIF